MDIYGHRSEVRQNLYNPARFHLCQFGRNALNWNHSDRAQNSRQRLRLQPAFRNSGLIQSYFQHAINRFALNYRRAALI